MARTKTSEAAPGDDARPSPTRIASPELRLEAKRAMVWVLVVGLTVLAIYISQALLVVFGAMVFAAMLDGGARLLGKVLKIGRRWRLAIVLVLAVGFLVWLGYFAGSQISREAAEFPAIIGEQIGRFLGWLRTQGFAIEQGQVQNIVGQLVSGVGTVTRAIGGVFGALSTVLLIAIIGVYLALEPRLYERGVAWMLPHERRADFYLTASRMAHTMRRLMAGRLAGMVFEGVFTWLMLTAYAFFNDGIPVPMAALLGIITGLLAFIPNIGALVAGALMVLVGFSGGADMGLWTILVYFVVQNFDGWILVPLIAKKTVDLAPALVLAMQLIMGVLFGVLGLFLADPLLAMIKIALERRSEEQQVPAKGKRGP
jgi:predicted PurR-regulated permease PerM